MFVLLLLFYRNRFVGFMFGALGCCVVLYELCTCCVCLCIVGLWFDVFGCVVILSVFYVCLFVVVGLSLCWLLCVGCCFEC